MPGSNNPNLFEPPSAEQLARHLENHPPVRTAGWQARGPMMVLVAVVVVSVLLAGSPGFALLPLLGLMGLMAYLSSRARAQRELLHRVTRVWELAMIRRYREALGQAWELIPACKNRPELHGRVVTVIAHVLGELKNDEAADVAYRYLLDRLPADHPLSLRLRLKSAVAVLCAGQLADADEALRKLRGAAEAAEDPSLNASYHLARLLQDVQTGHFADAVAQADETAEGLIPLGVEAGYGHGLLALCYHQLALHDPAAQPAERKQLAERARAWWDKATLLIPASALLYRHPDLIALREPTDTDTPAEPPRG